MNWYKEAQLNITVLEANNYGDLTLSVNGEIKKYQLPYTAVDCHTGIVNMIRKKQTKKIRGYLQWLDQYQLEEVKNMNIGVENILSKEENLAVVPGGI